MLPTSCYSIFKVQGAFARRLRSLAHGDPHRLSQEHQAQANYFFVQTNVDPAYRRVANSNLTVSPVQPLAFSFFFRIQSLRLQ